MKITDQNIQELKNQNNNIVKLVEQLSKELQCLKTEIHKNIKIFNLENGEQYIERKHSEWILCFEDDTTVTLDKVRDYNITRNIKEVNIVLDVCFENSKLIEKIKNNIKLVKLKEVRNLILPCNDSGESQEKYLIEVYNNVEIVEYGRKVENNEFPSYIITFKSNTNLK